VLISINKAGGKSNKGREAMITPEAGEVDAAVLHEHGDRGESAVRRAL
jgi:hypothetical protein